MTTRVFDLGVEAGKLTMLQNRTASTTAAEGKGWSAQLGAFRDGQIFTLQLHWRQRLGASSQGQ